MSAELRRLQVLATINDSPNPISASLLAKNLNVSRQIIVGDVALLRAQGHEIIATARGYIMATLRDEHKYLGKIACRHTPNETKEELYTIVDLGAIIMDVIVEHEVYGEITGQLNLRSRDDVDEFINRLNQMRVKLLSELTDGIHLHTLACRDKSHFDIVYQKLATLGYLVES